MWTRQREAPTRDRKTRGGLKKAREAEEEERPATQHASEIEVLCSAFPCPPFHSHVLFPKTHTPPTSITAHPRIDLNRSHLHTKVLTRLP